MSLLIDEAHNVLTPSVAKMLAEGRSAGLDAVFAWQYSAQIRDEVIRSGVRSLLQSISIFRMREMEDARSLAGLAMEVYSDRISVDHDEQERLRFSPDDIVKLPIHRAINLWVADGTPRAGFLAHTLPMEPLVDDERARAPRRPARPRRPPPRVPSRSDPATRVDARSGAADAAPEQPAQADRAHCGNRARADHVLRPRLMLARQLHRPDPLRRRRRPARPTRSDGAVRDPTARRRDPRRHLALQVPHRHPATRAALARLRAARRRKRLTKLFHAGLVERFRPVTRTGGSFPWTYHLGHDGHRLLRRTGALDRHARFELRTIYDYRYVLHEIHLNAWVLAWRRLLGPALLAWSGETDFEPPAEASGGQMRLDDDRTVRSLRWPTPRLVRPDAILEIERRDGGSRAVPDRVRPHPASRQELRQVPALRHLPVLVVARHLLAHRDDPRSCCSSAKTTSNERRSSTPPTGS